MGGGRERLDDGGWITINGTHVKTDKEGNLTGSVGKKIAASSKGGSSKKGSSKSGASGRSGSGYDPKNIDTDYKFSSGSSFMKTPISKVTAEDTERFISELEGFKDKYQKQYEDSLNAYWDELEEKCKEAGVSPTGSTLEVNRIRSELAGKYKDYSQRQHYRNETAAARKRLEQIRDSRSAKPEVKRLIMKNVDYRYGEEELFSISDTVTRKRRGY